MGAHVSGGLAGGLAYAHEVGARALQVFVSNPRGWAVAPAEPARDAAFRDGCAQAGMPAYVHAPYLVNLGSSNGTTYARSAAALTFALRRGRAIGARGVVVHTGSAVEPGQRAAGMTRTKAALLPLLDRLDDGDPDLLLEPTAGGGVPLGATVEQVGELVAALAGHPRLGICLDTCHAYAAGHDVASPGGMRATLTALVKAVGRGRLRLVHANDSRDPLGSGRDRHANIGDGRIGAEAFAELFRHAATRGVPVVVETPGGAQAQARDVATLTALRDR